MAQKEELNFLYYFRCEAEDNPMEIILIIRMRWAVSFVTGGRQLWFTGGCSWGEIEWLHLETIFLPAQSTGGESWGTLTDSGALRKEGNDAVWETLCLSVRRMRGARFPAQNTWTNVTCFWLQEKKKKKKKKKKKNKGKKKQKKKKKKVKQTHKPTQLRSSFGTRGGDG